MNFPGFDMLALGIILFVALREIVCRLRRIRAVSRPAKSAPAEA